LVVQQEKGQGKETDEDGEDAELKVSEP